MRRTRSLPTGRSRILNIDLFFQIVQENIPITSISKAEDSGHRGLENAEAVLELASFDKLFHRKNEGTFQALACFSTLE